MKVFSISAVAVLLAQSASAFAPLSNQASFGVAARGNVLKMAEDPVPFFAQSSEEPAPVEAAEKKDLDSLTLDEEVELYVEEEIQLTDKIAKLRNRNGAQYAPWINDDIQDERIRVIAKEKAEARRKRAEQEKEMSGNLFTDSQAQELSGTGLNYNVIDGQVELEWATKAETNTKGFVVKRRAAKTNDFTVLASYTEWGPLASQGVDGGIYRYLDESVTPGGWVYRISECDDTGSEADLCQCLVEVQTEQEQKAALIAGVGFGVFAIGAVVAGLVLDPYAG
jgi:hypothetical protein